VEDAALHATNCPRCGGSIIGAIKRREDRLDALEAYEEKTRQRRR
jgi:hypothetical protein